MHFRILIRLWFIFNTGILSSQIPQTSLYLLHIENPTDTIWNITKIEYLSEFNVKGYNNQPCFIAPNDLLASIKTTASSNTDIYRFDLIKKTFTNITSSSSSEYSARLSPYNTQNITCVSVPSNDTSVQNLVEIKLENGEYSKIIFNKFAKIGYYRHVKDQIWICYLVEEPHVLSICDAGKSNKKIFASSIGRSFEVINRNEVLFVHKITPEHWILKSYNLTTEKSKQLTEMPPGTEDFAMDEAGNIYCASDSKIYKLSQDGKWLKLVDLMPLNIRNINRLAISKNKMAVVSIVK